MDKQDLRLSFEVEQSPEEVFNAVNNVRGWWTDSLEGNTEKQGDEFSVVFYGTVHYSKQKLAEVVPGSKVVWEVTDSKLNFIKDQHEWIGTSISFDIQKKGSKTELIFTHHGLTPQVECYKDCSPAWVQYVNSLRDLITTGVGKPTLKTEMEVM